MFWVKSLQGPFLQAVCLNLVFLLLCLGVGGVHSGSLDDYFMSAIITGAYGGEFDPHTLFVNGAYAYFLKPFYVLFPWVGWYFIFEMLSVLAAFMVFTYFMLRQVGDKLGVALSCFLLVCLAPDFYLQLEFTKCAAASTAAAILLFYFGNSEQRKLWVVLGGLLFVVGIVFRKEGLLLGMPFLAVMLVLSVFETRKIMKMTLAVFVACVCAYLALQNFNNNLFQNEEYSYYREYQWSRAVFGDGANYDIDATYDELEERGMQGQDFWGLRSWIFYDTKVLSLDSLKPFVDVTRRNRFEVNYARMPLALFLVVAKSFFKPNAWCWIVLCFMFFFFIPKRANWYTWGSFALLCLCMGYLLYVNRVVYHVESGIWLYAIVCAIPVMRKDDFVIGEKLKNLPYLIFGLALGGLILALSSQREIDNDKLFFGVPKMSAEWQDFWNYTQAHPSDVFLLYFNDYKYLGTYKNPPYRAASPGSWANVVSLGYWNINLPGIKKELEKRGVTNPIGDIVKDNVYVLVTNKWQDFSQYYKVHYHREVVRDTVAKFGDLNLVKYHFKGGEP